MEMCNNSIAACTLLAGAQQAPRRLAAYLSVVTHCSRVTPSARAATRTSSRLAAGAFGGAPPAGAAAGAVDCALTGRARPRGVGARRSAAALRALGAARGTAAAQAERGAGRAALFATPQAGVRPSARMRPTDVDCVLTRVARGRLGMDNSWARDTRCEDTRACDRFGTEKDTRCVIRGLHTPRAPRPHSHLARPVNTP